MSSPLYEVKINWLTLEMQFIWYSSLKAWANPWLEHELGGSISEPKVLVKPEMVEARTSYGTFQRAILKLLQRARANRNTLSS